MENKAWVLLFCNIVLIATGWILAFYAYPRLPETIPLWLSFLSAPLMLMPKSPLFFIYPAAQTLFALVFLFLPQIKAVRDSQDWGKNRLREFVYLVLIFFQVLFIHIQRSMILSAHDMQQGVDPLYFMFLILIILLLIPFFRLREKILGRLKK
ncbi:MAG: hypothetical protein R6V02_03270 [Candidatus Aminicenantes bacterium]